MMTTSSLSERFDAKWTPEPNTGCWLWTDSVHPTGYGSLWANGRTRRAHRVAWELYRGPIPDGLVIDHMCRVRSCVNPDHLRAVTPRQNILENSIGITAINARKTHCKNGHALTPDNLRPGVRKHPGRNCLTCHRTQDREYKRAKYGHRPRYSHPEISEDA